MSSRGFCSNISFERVELFYRKKCLAESKETGMTSEAKEIRETQGNVLKENGNSMVGDLKVCKVTGKQSPGSLRDNQ